MVTDVATAMLLVTTDVATAMLLIATDAAVFAAAASTNRHSSLYVNFVRWTRVDEPNHRRS